MKKSFCIVQYILSLTEFPGALVYQNQFLGRLSIDGVMAWILWGGGG